MSLGLTPGIRDAWPMVVGAYLVSFVRASMVIDCNFE